MGRKAEDRSPAVQKWIDQNPLLRWRAEFPHRREMQEVAKTLACARSALYKWTWGDNYPDRKMMRRLARCMGTDAASLEKAWQQWFQSRPAE